MNEDVFKNLCDSLSKNTIVVEKNGNDYYDLFDRFLHEEYYKYYDNEDIPIVIECSLEVETNLGQY